MEPNVYGGYVAPLGLLTMLIANLIIASQTLLLALHGPALQHEHSKRVLWVGAHPDDEALIAPLLAQLCIEHDNVCAMLVMTHGEHGECALPEACTNLGKTRAAEMKRAATLFRSRLVLWHFSDVLGDVQRVWASEAGGSEQLVERIEFVIKAEQPTIVYTFDPMHGSTCHAAHRAIGQLVLDAVAQMGRKAPRVVLVETAVRFAGSSFQFSAATAAAQSWDATRTWSYLVKDAEIHASQFTSEQLANLRNVGIEQQRVFLLRALDTDEQKYVLTCP